MILAQTVKGWTLGPDFEARNAVHQMKKLSSDALKTFRDRLVPRRLATRTLEGDLPPYVHPGEDSDEIAYLLERRKELGGSVPERRVSFTVPSCRTTTPTARSRRGRASRRSPRRWRSCASSRTCCATRTHRPADRADHPRRGPHLRHGLVVPDRQDLRPSRPDLRTGRPGPAADLQAGQGRPDHPRGHHRGRIGRHLRGGRDQLRHPRRADDPALRLLLDVRLPADGRLDLVRRRPARPRVPDRCDRRRHHPQRRGPAAPGPALAADGPVEPGRRGLRPVVRLRAGGPRRARPASGCTATAGASRAARTSSTTSPSTTSRSSSRRCPTTSTTSRSSTGCTASRRASPGSTRPTSSRRAPSPTQALEAQQLLAEDWDVAADVWSAPGWNRLLRDGFAVESWNRTNPEAEPAGPAGDAHPRGHRGSLRRRVRLDAGDAVPDRRLGPRTVRGARDRRVRTLRHPRRAAPLPPHRRGLHRVLRPGRAREGRHARRRRAAEGDRAVRAGLRPHPVLRPARPRTTSTSPASRPTGDAAARQSPRRLSRPPERGASRDDQHLHRPLERRPASPAAAR